MIGKIVSVTHQTITISDITIQDAQDLVDILGYIGGSPVGPRGACDRLVRALEGVGLVWSEDKRIVVSPSSMYVERKS